jgi:hypothetical protein
MDREYFEDLIISDEHMFAGYAKLFLGSGGSTGKGFLEWCWEHFQAEPSSSPTTFFRLARLLGFFLDRSPSQKNSPAR